MFDFSAENIQMFILTYPVFLLALSFHEMAHAITAKWGGDLTAAYQGRVTMNPLAHIDPLGTVIMPILMAVSTGIPLFGWAKPVPVVSTNYRRGSSYDVVVSFAGPFSNIVLAIAGAILLQVYTIACYVLEEQGVIVPTNIHSMVDNLIWYMIMINIALAFFNMIPIPPLDGSHILWHWFIKHRPKLRDIYAQIGPYGFIVLILLLRLPFFSMIVSLIIIPIIYSLYGFGMLPSFFLY